MPSAAGQRSLFCALLLVAALLAATSVATRPATARVLAPPASTLPDRELWAVQVGGSRAELRLARLFRLRAHGVNTLVLNGGVTRSRRASAAARRAGLRLIVPVSGAGDPARACAEARRALRTPTCALTAESSAGARRLLATGVPDLVVARVRGPAEVAALRGREYEDRVLALPQLRSRVPLAGRRWRAAINLAARDASLDLGVAPTRPGGRGFAAYLRLLKRQHRRDLQRPSAPSSLATSASTPTSLTISWGRSRDNRAVVRYVVRRNSAKVAEVRTTRATLEGLGCAASHDLRVEARDRAGNVSVPSPALRATTAACGGGGGGGPPPPPPPPGFPPPPPPPPPSRPGTVLPLGTSLDAAYRNAKPGETFLLAPGCWGGVTIGHDPAKTASGAQVVFAAQDFSNRPVFGSCESGRYQGNGIDLHGVKALILDGVVVNGDLGIVPDGSTLAENVVVMRSRIKTTHVRAANGVIFQDTEFGNYRYDEPGGPTSSWISNYPGTPPARNIQIERTTFHNIRQGASSTHAECLMLDNVETVTIRHSTLKDCPTMSLFLSGDNGGVARNVLIERNFFSCPAPNDTVGCGATINMRPDHQFQNVLWRSNDIQGLVYLQGGGSDDYSSVRFENNRVGQMSACHSSVTYVNNTSTAGRDCDPGGFTPPIGP
jgi:hypothetical protein